MNTVSGQIACRKSRPGYKCVVSGGQKTETICPTDTYSTGGTDTCTACSSGTIKVNTDSGNELSRIIFF